MTTRRLAVVSGGPSAPASAPGLMLAGAVPPDGRRADLRVSGALVSAVEPTVAAPSAAGVVSLGGHVLLPAFADPHAHLGGPIRPSGSAAGALPRRALAHLAAGATALRAQVGVGDAVRLRDRDAALALRDELAGHLVDPGRRPLRAAGIGPRRGPPPGPWPGRHWSGAPTRGRHAGSRPRPRRSARPTRHAGGCRPAAA